MTRFVHEVHRQRTTNCFNARFKRGALFFGEGSARNGSEHLDDVTPGLCCHDDVAKLTDLSHRSRRVRQSRRRTARKSANIDRCTEIVAHVGARKWYILDVMVRDGRLATGAASKEAVKDIDEPQGATERFVFDELIGIASVLVNGNNTVHLGHAGSLTQIDVGSDGIAVTPFVDDQKAKSLNICQARVVEVLHDYIDRFDGKMLGGSRCASLSPIATNQSGRAPTHEEHTWLDKSDVLDLIQRDILSCAIRKEGGGA